MANAKYVSRKQRGESPTYTFSLNRSELFWLAAGGLLLLCILFLFGVLVGRGWRVEEPLQIVEVQEPTHGVLQTEEPEPEDRVLRAEDLSYQQSLSQPEPQANEPRSAEPEPEVVEAGPDQQAAIRPEPEAAPEAVAEPTPEPVGPKDPTALPAPESGENVYAYVFQAASYRTTDRAEGLKAKLEEAGLSAKVREASVKGEQWHRVQVGMDLSPSQAGVVIERVKALTGEKPVRLSKKLVE